MADADAYRTALARARGAVAANEPLSPLHVEVLLEVLRDYESAITWDVTCLNCSHLLDQLYALEADTQGGSDA